MTTLAQIQSHLGVPADGKLGPVTLAAIAEALGMDGPATTKGFEADGLTITGFRGELVMVSGDEIPDDYWPMLSKIESGDRPYIKAGTSSASGLYQFIRSTWKAEGGQWGPDMTKAFGGLKPSVEEQLQRAKSFTAKNAAVLKGKGIPINRASLYAAHFFGAGMAAKVIGADVNARADHIAGAAATNANPSILKGKTVGEFLTWLHRKTGEWAR